jgi:hypothetical protein
MGGNEVIKENNTFGKLKWKRRYRKHSNKLEDNINVTHAQEILIRK